MLQSTLLKEAPRPNHRTIPKSLDMNLNGLIHQPVRLRIMSALCAVPEQERVDFTTLRDHLDVTDGNLGGHLQRLEDAGYLDVTKTFVDQKPRTRIRASEAGRTAFLDHVLALQEVIRGPADLPLSSG